MTVICDSREKKNEHIRYYFKQHGIPYHIEKLAVADYMIDGKEKLVVDRKQNLDEVCRNLTYKGRTAAENGGNAVPSDVARFWREVRRAYKNGIKMVVLIEHGGIIKSFDDVRKWKSQHSKISGKKLYDEMNRLRLAYGIEWQFCSKTETASKILEILTEE